MLVFVLNHYGKPLMPCKPRKARLLLKEGKAKVITHGSLIFGVKTEIVSPPLFEDDIIQVR